MRKLLEPFVFCFFFFANSAVKHSYSKEKYVVLPPVTKKSYVKIFDHHLFHTYQLFRIRHQSPGLPYGSPYLPDKIIFWSLLCLSLRFSPFLAQNLSFSYSLYGFRGIFAPIKVIDKDYVYHQNEDCEFWWYVLHVRLDIMSLVIPIFVGGEIHWISGGGVVKKRESSDSRSSELGISAICS